MRRGAETFVTPHVPTIVTLPLTFTTLSRKMTVESADRFAAVSLQLPMYIFSVKTPSISVTLAVHAVPASWLLFEATKSSGTTQTSTSHEHEHTLPVPTATEHHPNSTSARSNVQPASRMAEPDEHVATPGHVFREREVATIQVSGAPEKFDEQRPLQIARPDADGAMSPNLPGKGTRGSAGVLHAH